MSSEGAPHTPDGPPHARRLQLPTGARVQLVYRDRGEIPGRLQLSVGASVRSQRAFSHTRIASRAQRRELGPSSETEPLHVCFHCLAELVYAADWIMEGHGDWRVLLLCPDCGASREGVFDKAAVERLNDDLDRALMSMLADLRLLTAANMQEEIDVFVRALRDDLIGPSDFAQR